MPVFSRFRDGVLVLTVDGDHTPNELRRVAFNAFESDATPPRTPVLLDMSGAAGLTGKSSEDMRASGAIFDAYRDRVERLAVVVSGELRDLFRSESDFGREVRLPVDAFPSHAEARAWLGGDAT